MGTFYTSCRVENPVARERSARLSRVLADTGSEYTWMPETTLEKIGIDRERKDLDSIMANGKTITRSVGLGIVGLDKYFTIDEVVFGQREDLSLLGARTLEGLNLAVDSTRKKLVATRPLLAAMSAQAI